MSRCEAQQTGSRGAWPPAVYISTNLEYPCYISPIDFGAEYYADEWWKLVDKWAPQIEYKLSYY